MTSNIQDKNLYDNIYFFLFYAFKIYKTEFCIYAEIYIIKDNL